MKEGIGQIRQRLRRTDHAPRPGGRGTRFDGWVGSMASRETRRQGAA